MLLRKVFEEKLGISYAELSEINDILTQRVPWPEDADKQIFKTFTANMGEGWEIDVKVCNGDIPYIDAVLFYNGQEVSCDASEDTILGEYQFSIPSGFGDWLDVTSDFKLEVYNNS